MNATPIKPRCPWLAALLSLLGGPVGQIYAGHLGRSIALWVLGAFVLPLLLFAFLILPQNRIAFNLLMLCATAFPLFLIVDAFILARRNRDAPLKQYQRWWLYFIALIAFIAANTLVASAIKMFLAEAFIVPTRAMSPTIRPGDRILVDKFRLNRYRPKRGDVVVYRSDGPHSAPYIMRVAGLPGDKIVISKERVYINDVEWTDSHATFDDHLAVPDELANYGPIEVPSDCFFVLGDNRRLSKDSRIRGPIPLADLCGKARMIYWSHLREFPDPNNTSRYTVGPILWDRIGLRLD